MGDVIKLLSDHIANQIAAGEVIQRPSSAVKELLENAIDANATEIQLIIKDAGKELIQVVDNGKGMSPTDARMAFERHATSKISSIDDLFTIRTMGFRGEALASIAAVTQVELRTCQAGAEAGTRILIEGTEVKLQEPCAQPQGSNIQLKNLFYNVPARRNFLKSTTAEYRHIVDEFTRVALAYPNIAFKLINNGVQQFQLASGSLKQRIVGLLGNAYEKKMVPVDECDDLLHITGFIGKPEAAARTRGMQYFFINNRFIRNAYLHHAVVQAYEGLLEKESFPFYVLFLEVDPAKVDVNVHPTKQEVKFDDDKLMYAYLNAAVKHALAKYNIAPSIDFSLNAEIMRLSAIQQPFTESSKRDTEKGYLYNVFTEKGQAHAIERKDSLAQWKDLYAIAAQKPEGNTQATFASNMPIEQPHAMPQLYQNENSFESSNMLLIHGDLLATTVKSGMMLIHIRRAQERIWYERLQAQWSQQNAVIQKLLFPLTLDWPPQDAVLLQELLPDLVRIGFDIAPFGQHTFVIQGVPTNLPPGEEKNVIDEVIEHLKHQNPDAAKGNTDMILIHMAKRLGRNVHALLQPDGQQALIDELFACSQPEYTPSGKKVFVLVKRDALDNMLG